MASPSTPASDGRDGQGRFSAGNRFAKGNPHAKRVAKLRSELYEAVGTDRLRRIVEALVREAEAGNVQAAREVLDRVLGKAGDAVDLLERLERLEESLETALAAKERR